MFRQWRTVPAVADACLQRSHVVEAHCRHIGGASDDCGATAVWQHLCTRGVVVAAHLPAHSCTLWTSALLRTLWLLPTGSCGGDKAVACTSVVRCKQSDNVAGRVVGLMVDVLLSAAAPDRGTRRTVANTLSLAAHPNHSTPSHSSSCDSR